MIHDVSAYQRGLVRHSVQIDVRQIAGIVSQLQQAPILDLGSGIGCLANELCKYGLEVYQVDGAREMLNVAASVFGSRLVQGSITALPFRDQAVPVVILSFVLHHLTDVERRACLGECRRVLHREGVLFIVERVPVCQAIRKMFPIYWYLVYRYQHEWQESCPNLRTLSTMQDELCRCGFRVQNTSKLTEPPVKLLKRVIIPKMVIMARSNPAWSPDGDPRTPSFCRVA